MADLQRMRTDLGYFAHAIGQPLTDWQVEALALESTITVLVAGRQMGKSRSLAVLALWWAYTRSRNRVFIISASELGSRRLLAEVRQIVFASPLLSGSALDEQSSLLTLSNGSEIRSAPASEKAIRGWQNDLLLIDEAGSPTADLILSAALPTLTARVGARAVIADSAWAAEGPFYDFARAGSDGGDGTVRTFSWVSTVAGGSNAAPWVSPSIVAAAKAAMGPMRFAAEYLCQFGSASDAMFSRTLLQRAAAPMVLPALGDLAGDARLLAGVDWGRRVDRSALVAFGRLPVALLNTGVDRPVFVTACVQQWEQGYPLSEVEADVAGARAPWSAVSMETNGIGEGPSQNLSRLLVRRDASLGGGRAPRQPLYMYEWDSTGRMTGGEFFAPGGRGWRGPKWNGPGPPPMPPDRRTRRVPVATSAESKSQTYGRLHYLLDRGQLVIPDDSEFMRELLSLRVEMREHGRLSIQAMTGRHDDLADAAYLGCGPYRTRKGAWRSLLTDAAAVGLPDVEVASDDPVITTGGGLLLNRRPVVQSIDGDELTIPDGAGLLQAA
jgi:hypothetical protein